MSFQVTSLYACLVTAWVVILANIVSAKRGRAGVSILHGGDMKLAVWIRRHGNLVENAALALLLMALCEARGMPQAWLHAIGVLLIAARLAHAAGLDATRPGAPLRVIGGAGTQLAMLAAVAYLVWSLV